MASQPNEHDPRVFFAAERTLLAWIRTSLALMGIGFMVARFDLLSDGFWSVATGSAVIAISITFIIASTRLYVTTVRRMMRNEPFEGKTSSLALIFAGFLVLLGAAMVAYLLI